MDDAPAPVPPRDAAGRPTDAATAAQADASSAPPGRYRLLELSLWLLRMGPGLILIVLVLAINGLTPLFLTPRNLGRLREISRLDSASRAAIRAGDPEAARAAALLHVADVLRFFREHPHGPDEDEA